MRLGLEPSSAAENSGIRSAAACVLKWWKVLPPLSRRLKAYPLCRPDQRRPVNAHRQITHHDRPLTGDGACRSGSASYARTAAGRDKTGTGPGSNHLISTTSDQNKPWGRFNFVSIPRPSASSQILRRRRRIRPATPLYLRRRLWLAAVAGGVDLQLRLCALRCFRDRALADRASPDPALC
jgi:hypothetical protein